MGEWERISDRSLIEFHGLLHGKKPNRSGNFLRILSNAIYPIFLWGVYEEQPLSEEMIKIGSDFGARLGLSSGEAVIFGTYFMDKFGQLNYRLSEKIEVDEDPVENLVDNLILQGLSQDLEGTRPLRQALKNAGRVAASCLAPTELDIDGTKHFLNIQLSDIESQRALVQ